MGNRMKKLMLRLQPVFILGETKLEASGRWDEAQQLRSGESRFWTAGQVLIDWTINKIETDLRIQEIVQRETYLKEECERLNKKRKDGTLTKPDEEQLECWVSELEDLNREYWRQERQDYLLEPNAPPQGPFRRAFDFTHRNPIWHLESPWLRSDCAGRGGCCGRGCGCCERPRSTTRMRHFGHCTAACGCCQRARGFELKPGSDDHDLVRSSVDKLKERKDCHHKDRLLRAYVFGS